MIRRYFTVKTDQRSVEYMFDKRQKSKIKKDKILRSRMELSCHNFEIRYPTKLGEHFS